MKPPKKPKPDKPNKPDKPDKPRGKPEKMDRSVVPLKAERMLVGTAEKRAVGPRKSQGKGKGNAKAKR